MNDFACPTKFGKYHLVAETCCVLMRPRMASNVISVVKGLHEYIHVVSDILSNHEMGNALVVGPEKVVKCRASFGRTLVQKVRLATCSGLKG